MVFLGFSIFNSYVENSRPNTSNPTARWRSDGRRRLKAVVEAAFPPRWNHGDVHFRKLLEAMKIYEIKGYKITNLFGGIPTPLKNMSSSLGATIPWKN